MKILYDHQIFTIQNIGGISRYFSELMTGVNSTSDMEVYLSLKYSNNIHLANTPFYRHKEFFKDRVFKGKRLLQDGINKWQSNKMLKTCDYNLFHPTYYNSYFLPALDKKPFVVTVFDMIHEKLPQFFPSNEIISQQKRCLVEQASKVIAISHSTKEDLIEILDVPENKVEVIYLGNSLNIVADKEFVVKERLPDYYLLFVGRRNQYKNFHTFIRAAQQLMETDKTLEVVCAGGGEFTNKEMDLFKSLNILERVHSFHFLDSELQTAYANAACFVFPSLYEGFGLPLLEAFSVRCPVACSNTGSLPEVAGNAAAFFNPLSAGEIAEEVHKVLTDSSFKSDLIQNGLNRQQKFSWKVTTEKTRDVYKSVCH